MKNYHETAVLEALGYLPEIFNLTELWNKLQDVCGIYSKKDNNYHYKISNQTLYKYLNKYCIKQPQGQWRKVVK